MSWLRSVLVAFMVAVIGLVVTVSPFGEELEQFGLRWMFRWRGPVAPPADVVVITQDKQSARELGQGTRTENWSRALHAELIGALRSAGAAMVVVDMFFDHPQPAADDERLAMALGESGNVLLAQRISRVGYIDHLINPVQSVAGSVAGLAPFPLPKVPENVAFFWPFYPVAQPSDPRPDLICHADEDSDQRVESGTANEPRIMQVVDAPTIPVAALALMTLRTVGYDQLLTRLSQMGISRPAELPDQISNAGDLCDLLDGLRQRLRGDMALASELSASGPDRDAASKLVDELLRVATRIDPVYINFYGPPATLRTVRYAELFDQAATKALADLSAFRDQIVFIGAGDITPIDQVDGFRTVFSTRSGLDIPGVEIAATAFANIATGRDLQRLTPGSHALLVSLLGLLLGLFAARLPGVWGLGGALVPAGAWFLFAAWQFSAAARWLPVFIPIAIQLPVALLASQFWKYVVSRSERDRYRESLYHYLPGRARVALTSGRTASAGTTELVFGVCMVTDIEGYTTLSERVTPTELAQLKNEYFGLLDRDVEGRGGEVLHIEGDSLAAVWIGDENDPAVRLNACLGALDVTRSVMEFNDRHPDTPLPTRVGLRAGELAIGDVGGGGRYTYTVTGDIINTASRIEGLNKLLGTNVLCGEETIAGLDTLVKRRVGRFLLKGKLNEDVVYEIVSVDAGEDPARRALWNRFEEGLALFEAGDVAKAQSVFDPLAVTDGPSRFYARYCREFPLASDPVIRVETK